VCAVNRSVRVHFISEAVFQREVDDANETRIIGYFHSRPIAVTPGQTLDLNLLANEMNKLVEQFTCRGSGLVLTSVGKLTAVVVRFRPLGGSSYIPTPAWLRGKRAIINVKCHTPDCYRWAILSALYPASLNSDRVNTYAAYRDDIDCSGLKFPVQPQQIPIFERDNPTIAVHCLAYDKASKSFSILYLSPAIHKRPRKITLLLLDSPNGKKKHYVWVKDLSRLIASKFSRRCRRYVCLSCLQSFTSQRVLEEHEMHCLMHAPQQCAYPTGEKALMRFNAHHCEFPFDFYLASDFECFLKPIPAPQPEAELESESESKFPPKKHCPAVDVNTHVPSGFCVYRVTEHEDYQTPPFTYSGERVMEKFFDHIFKEAKTISDILSQNVPMTPLTDDEWREFNRATTCRNCNESFSFSNPKTRHHSHVSGHYLFPACSNCNLALKPESASFQATSTMTSKKEGYIWFHLYSTT